MVDPVEDQNAREALPPFDAEARCPKCAYDAVHTVYVKAWGGRTRADYDAMLAKACDAARGLDGEEAFRAEAAVGANIRSSSALRKRGDVVEEHLNRTCARCQHVWREACVEVGRVSDPKPFSEVLDACNEAFADEEDDDER